MSFNLGTKINNLYQLIGSKLNNYISAVQDSFTGTNNQVGTSGGTIDIKFFQNIQGSNIVKPSSNFTFIDTTYRTNTEVQIGTINKPSDFVGNVSINGTITGQMNFLSAGFAEGGIKIRDVNNVDVFSINVGTNRDSVGNFNINLLSNVSLTPSQFPLKVIEYIYYSGWFMNNSVVPFTANIYLNYSNNLNAYWQFDPVAQNFKCLKAGNYLITQVNTCLNNGGTASSNLIISTLKNGSIYTFSNYDTIGINTFSNNSQITQTSCEVNDTISLSIESTNFCRVITTNLVIQEI